MDTQILDLYDRKEYDLFLKSCVQFIEDSKVNSRHTDKLYHLLNKIDEIHSWSEESITWLQDQSTQKNSTAQYMLGLCKSSDNYRISAKNGNSKAQMLLGLDYQNAGDYISAFDWFEQSSDQGDSEGQHYLALMHELGDEICECNNDKAKQLYILSAEQGHNTSMCALGDMYRYEWGMLQEKKYHDKSIEWSLRCDPNND